MKMKRLPLFAVVSLAIGFTGCSFFGADDPLVARVGSEKIYKSDVDFVRMMQPAMAATEKKREILINLVSEREMYIAAQEKFGDSNDSVEIRLDQIRDRMLTRIYQQLYVSDGLGHTEAQLNEYYNAHRGEFKKDSCADFIECRTKVASVMYLAENKDSLNAFFAERLKSYQEPARVEIAYFRSSDSSAVRNVVESLSVKKSTDSIPGFVRGNVSEKDTAKGTIFADAGVKAALFGKNAVAVGDGSFRQVSVKMGDSSYFVVLKVLSRTPAKSKTLEEVRPSLETAFADSYRSHMMQTSADSLKKAFGMQLEKIKIPDGRKYYEAHKNLFKTKQGFEVYHVENGDSAALAKAIDKPLMLSDFKALATSMSTNDSTRGHEGYVGIVRVGEPLPYGIGAMPGLFSAFNGKQQGEISPVMKSASGRYQVFYLDKAVSPEIPPYEKVASEVQKQMESSGDFTLDSSYVLATEKGKSIICERDVLKLRDEIPEVQRAMYPRNRLLPMMLEWKAFAKAAQNLEMDKTWFFKAFVTSTRIGLYNKMLNDSLQKGLFNISDKDIHAGYAKYGKTIFGGVAEDSIRSQLALYLSTSPLTLKHEYYANSERYEKYADFTSAEPEVFKMIFQSERNAWFGRFRSDLHKVDRIHVYDTTFLPLADPYSKDSLLRAADTSYKTRNLAAAEEAWEHLRMLYPADDSLFARATFQIAQLENENEHFDAAQHEYRAFYSMWPKSPDAEKAIFTRGFILHENLKQDSAALAVFRDFAAKYPKSDLMESVNWLIKDIESKGKLGAELLDKISKEDAAGK